MRRLGKLHTIVEEKLSNRTLSSISLVVVKLKLNFPSRVVQVTLFCATVLSLAIHFAQPGRSQAGVRLRKT